MEDRLFKKNNAICFSLDIGAETMHATVQCSTPVNEVCACIAAATHPGRKRLGEKGNLKTIPQ